jgi:hypothetical protein
MATVFPSLARTATALLAAAWLAGCAATTEIQRASDESIPQKPAQTLVVAGVTQDDALRRAYEEVFVAQLQKAGLNGVGSNRLFSSTQGMTMSELRDRMHAATVVADAVVHVQLVTLTGTPVLSPDDIPAEQAPAHGEIAGVSININTPPAGAVRGTQYAVELQSTVYELPSRKLLWTATTVTREANSLEAVARSHAKALIREMKKRGYLAKGK